MFSSEVGDATMYRGWPLRMHGHDVDTACYKQMMFRGREYSDRKQAGRKNSGSVDCAETQEEGK